MQKNSIGSRLRIVRNNLHKTRDEFALELNTSRNTIARYESDERVPSVEYLLAIHQKYGVNLHWLLLGDTTQEGDEQSCEVSSDKGKSTPLLLNMNEMDFITVLLIDRIVQMSRENQEHLLFFIMGIESKNQ